MLHECRYIPFNTPWVMYHPHCGQFLSLVCLCLKALCFQLPAFRCLQNVMAIVTWWNITAMLCVCKTCPYLVGFNLHCVGGLSMWSIDLESRGIHTLSEPSRFAVSQKRIIVSTASRNMGKKKTTTLLLFFFVFFLILI